ncbi:hypothetical protein [Sporichthya brevicatena]
MDTGSAEAGEHRHPVPYSGAAILAAASALGVHTPGSCSGGTAQ